MSVNIKCPTCRKRLVFTGSEYKNAYGNTVKELKCWGCDYTDGIVALVDNVGHYGRRYK